MGFLKLFNCSETKTSPNIHTEPGTVYSPISGTVITLAEIGDGVFSEGLLGPGCGVRSTDEYVYAPFDGTIVQIADTKHAIGISSVDGIELLIHVGIDTVGMNGKGFTIYVSDGERVKCGQKLLKFCKKDIEAASCSDTVVVLVTNSDRYSSVETCAAGVVNSFDKLMTVK